MKYVHNSHTHSNASVKLENIHDKSIVKIDGED